MGLKLSHLRLKVLDLSLVLALNVLNRGLGGADRLNLLDQGAFLVSEFLSNLGDLRLVFALNRLELEHELVDLLSLL